MKFVPVITTELPATPLVGVNDAVFPATSLTVTVYVYDEPCAENVRGEPGVAAATPDVVYGSVKAELFQPAEFGARVAVPKVSVGAVASMSMVNVCADSALPGVSTDQNVTV